MPSSQAPASAVASGGTVSVGGSHPLETRLRALLRKAEPRAAAAAAVPGARAALLAALLARVRTKRAYADLFETPEATETWSLAAGLPAPQHELLLAMQVRAAAERARARDPPPPLSLTSPCARRRLHTTRADEQGHFCAQLVARHGLHHRLCGGGGVYCGAAGRRGAAVHLPHLPAAGRLRRLARQAAERGAGRTAERRPARCGAGGRVAAGRPHPDEEVDGAVLAAGAARRLCLPRVAHHLERALVRRPRHLLGAAPL